LIISGEPEAAAQIYHDFARIARSLTGVAHDATLQGNGIVASPLGLAVPLTLSGSLGGPVISATNSASSSFAMIKCRK